MKKIPKLVHKTLTLMLKTQVLCSSSFLVRRHLLKKIVYDQKRTSVPQSGLGPETAFSLLSSPHTWDPRESLLLAGPKAPMAPAALSTAWEWSTYPVSKPNGFRR